MTGSGAREIRSEWKNGGEFLPNFFAGRPAKLFQPLAGTGLAGPGLEVDALVSVFISFADREADFHMHATVVEKRPSGLLLEFLVEEENRIEWVLACARGESLPYQKRRRERIPCEVKAKITAKGGGVFVGVTTNVNEGGAHVALDELPAAEDALVVVLNFSGGPVTFPVRVVSVIQAGPQRGVAIEFQFQSSEQRERFALTVAGLRG